MATVRVGWGFNGKHTLPISVRDVPALHLLNASTCSAILSAFHQLLVLVDFHHFLQQHREQREAYLNKLHVNSQMLGQPYLIWKKLELSQVE